VDRLKATDDRSDSGLLAVVSRYYRAQEPLGDLDCNSQELWHTNPADGSPGGFVTPSVFISYRREDCPGHAGRLFDHLRTRFGGASVFMDVTDIEAGVDFVDVLQRAVGSCDVLLAVIGREWLTCTDRNGRRRLDDPHDFIRLEVGIALTRNVRVIPVLVEGAVVPTASELPSDLEGLTRRQAVELRDARWNADVESLAGVLDRVLGHTAVGNESTRNHLRRARWWGLAAAALVAAVVAVVTLVPRGSSTPSAPAPQSVSGAPTPAEQRTPVQAEPPASASSGAAARTNPAPATEQPIRTPASQAPQPAPPTAAPSAMPQATAPMQPAAPVASGTVLVYYAADDDQPTAEDLAAGLRESMNDPRYIVRTLKTSRGVGGEGEVRYSSSGLSALAGTLARSAGSRLSRTYGHRVAFTPTVEPRVSTNAVIVIMPGRTPAAADRLADPVVTIAYPTADEPTVAEELATFLRMRSGTKYRVRTVRATTGPRKEGQIEYDNERMARVAQVLARDAAAWISRAYGHQVVLQPTPTSRIGSNAVLIWLPSR
jgi:hypothetical protein